MNNIWRLVLFTFLAVSTAFSFAAGTRLKIQDNGNYITGKLKLDTGVKVKFEVDMTYKELTKMTYTIGDTEISGEINTSSGTVAINGITSSTGEIATASKANKNLFKEILTGFQNKTKKIARKFKGNETALDGMGMLFKMTEFLITVPENNSLDIMLKRDISAAGWTDLCPYYGRSRTAYWDTSYNKSATYTVGGHGFCAGRCGAGCNWWGDPQYSQDCLNHDVCADREGQQYGVCGDEWNAAADDFWFSPDCPGVN